MGLLRLKWITGVLCVVAGCTIPYYLISKKDKDENVFDNVTKDLLRKALLAEQRGYDGDAERDFHEALKTCHDSDSITKTIAIRGILLKMADFYRQRDRPDKALAIYEQLLMEMGRSGSNANEMDEALILKAAGDLLCDIGSLSKAESFLEKAIETVEALPNLKDDASISGPLYESFANVKFKQKNYSMAIEFYQMAARKCKEERGEHDLLYINLLNNIASCYFIANTKDSLFEAKVMAKKALDIVQTSKSLKVDPSTSQNLNMIINRTL